LNKPASGTADHDNHLCAADVNYPNAVKRSVDSNGYVTDLNTECTDDLTNLQPDAGTSAATATP